MALALGAIAPDFTLPDQVGNEITLTEVLTDKAVVLVFYPFAFSGICTGELTGFRDQLERFETDQVTLMAISCDPVYSLRAFADRDALFFPLLSDFWPHGTVSKEYDAFADAIGGSTRDTFVIGRDRRIRAVVSSDLGQARDLDQVAAAVAHLDKT